MLLTIPACALAIALAPQSFRDVQIETTRVAEGIFMLVGAGGNIGLSVGEDGAFMIDDQFAPLTGKITAAVAELSDQPVRFVVNTHFHGDHTGGNENFGEAGAVIVAHENVRERMSTEQVMELFGRRVPPSPPEALPVITFAESVTFHWNGQELHVFHIANAHTDGDAVIHFRKANVIHAGDIVFNGTYPFIDVPHGGRVQGMIDGVNRILELCDGSTKIIPGHGALATPADLRAYRGMLQASLDAVRPLVEAGRTRQQVMDERPTASLDEKWGGGFINGETWAAIVFDSITKGMEARRHEGTKGG